MPSRRLPVSTNSRMIARSRRLRKSRPAQLSSRRLTSASGRTGTGCSGMIGLRIFAMGEVSTSPSSSSQRKNCLQRAVARRGRGGRGALELARDERFHVLPFDGCDRGRHALAGKEHAEQSTVVGVAANRAGDRLAASRCKRQDSRSTLGWPTPEGAPVVVMSAKLDAVAPLCETAVRDPRQAS
jgi:hypothetical protein